MKKSVIVVSAARAAAAGTTAAAHESAAVPVSRDITSQIGSFKLEQQQQHDMMSDERQRVGTLKEHACFKLTK